MGHGTAWALGIIFMAAIALAIAWTVAAAHRRSRSGIFSASEPPDRPAPDAQSEFRFDLEDVHDENDPPASR